MLILEKEAFLLLTYSGGMQKGAYFHKIPCITLRPETEWTELIDNGYNRLALNDENESLLDAIQEITKRMKNYTFMEMEMHLS